MTVRLPGFWLLLLAGYCATPAAVAQPASNLAQGPGCLGVPVETCVGWLKSTMALDEGFIPAALARRHRVDVNGKPLGGNGLVTLTGKLPGRLEPMLVLLRLAPDDTVVSAEANLLQNLVAAQTEQEYDRSALYDMAARLYGRRCPGLAKLELYRFFHNSVKPRIVSERRDLSTGINGLHRLTLHANGLPYCGAQFGYTQQIEWRGSANPESGQNIVGSASITLQ